MDHVLTATQVKNAKSLPDGRPAKLWDGGGLHLYVSRTQAKSWRYKYRLADKEHLYSLGMYPEVGLAVARELHQQARALVNGGIHPRIHRQAEKHKAILEGSDTFKSVALEWIEKKEPSWSKYYAKQVKTFLPRDVFPVIGDLPVNSVPRASIHKILKSVEERGAPTVAINLRIWCSGVFRYAIDNLRAEADPTLSLKGAVTRPPVKHNVALKPAQITSLIAVLEKVGAYRTTAIALELLLLTFVRTAELRQATWDELDFEAREWRIPAARMKMKVAHVVPLSKQTVELLKELQKITGAGKWMFPNHRRPEFCMDTTTINQALKRLGFSGVGTIGFSAHGFRGTASTMLHEKGHRSEYIEKQLAHSERNQSKAAYNSAMYLLQRHQMMQDWADYIDKLRPMNILKNTIALDSVDIGMSAD